MARDDEVSPLFLVTVLLLVGSWIASYLWNWATTRSRRSSKTTPEELRQARTRAGLAAHQRQQHVVRRSKAEPKPIKKKPNTEEIRREVKQEEDEPLERDSGKSNQPLRATPEAEDSSSTNTPEEEEDSNVTDESDETEGIRQATLEDRVKWNEDRESQSQFGGFNIYGHKTDMCQECGGNEIVKQDIPMVASSAGCIHTIAHIPHLPMADEALQMLQDLAKEFEPVLQSRGWTVLVLSEMCCCGDGDEHTAAFVQKTSNPKNNNPNVMGYCVTTGNGRTALGIHIRLRPHASCLRGGPLSSYQEVVGTMAHEMAHIAEQNHSPKFYQIMAEIERQRLEFLGSGVVLANDGFPLGSAGHRLGSLPERRNEVLGSRELKRKIAESAQERQEHGGSNLQHAAAAAILAATPQPRNTPKPRRPNPKKRRAQLRAAEKRLQDAAEKDKKDDME